MVSIGERSTAKLRLRAGRYGVGSKEHSLNGRVSGGRAGAAALLGVALGACGTNNTYFEEHLHLESRDAGGEVAPGAAGSGLGVGSLAEDAGVVTSGAPKATVAAADLQIDVFGTLGNRYWFEASAEQVEIMNIPWLGNEGSIYSDYYMPRVGGKAEPTFVDHLFVTNAGDAPHTADFGKVQVRLVGQSTGRPWTEKTLPNFKIDTDEFIDRNTIGGVKHLRLNNAVFGSIYREKLTYDLYRKLGYPAPRTNYAWVSGSVWAAEVAVPYVVVESYKPQFCKLREADLGGGCVNMWEFYGDFGSGQLGLEASCQFSECDPSRALDFEDLVMETPPGDGFKAALADWLDWDAYHRFQCLSWMFQTVDDYIHTFNNVVLVERADGKFQFLPYSVDLSLSPDWAQDHVLAGINTLSLGCQGDPVCWADMIGVCEGMVAAYTAANPVAMLDAIQVELEQAGMLRDGDSGRYESLRSNLEQRLIELPEELELNRDESSIDSCVSPYVRCGGTCMFPEECFVCPEPPASEGNNGGDDAGAAGADAGADAASGADPEPSGESEACLPDDNYGIDARLR